jgi:hypothetical protein
MILSHERAVLNNELGRIHISQKSVRGELQTLSVMTMEFYTRNCPLNYSINQEH